MKTEQLKRVLLFLNTTSGVGNGRRDLVKIIEAFAKENCEVTVYPIMNGVEFDLNRIIKNRANDFDILVCYGGDGTLNYLVNALINNSIDKPIGYIAGGSTNDFSRNFTNEKTLEEKCKSIVHGKSFRYDVGLFNEKTYFNYVAAFGAFTKTSYTTSSDAKKILGYGAYALSALALMPESFSYRLNMEITHDNGKEVGTYIYGCISNSLSVGGVKFPFYKESLLDDGQFEVLLVKSPDNVGDVVNILNDLASGKVNDEYVHSFKTSKLRVKAEDKIMWTVDGEYGGEYKNTVVEVVSKRIEMMVKDED